MANLSEGTVRQSQMFEPSFVDPDGNIHISALTLSPSELWSAEFKEWYAALLVRAQELFRPLARNASKAEWDKFHAIMEDDLKARFLARALSCYPAKVVETEIAGVRVGVISPQNGILPLNQRRVLINLHGGAFVYYPGLSMGKLESAPVASIGQMTVITIDYRQAPSHQYPAASVDVEAVYRELLKQYVPGAIGIFGCSAGGALTAQAVTRFQAKGLPRPGAIGIFSTPPSPIWTNKGDSGIWWSSNCLPKSELSEADRIAFEPSRWYMSGADPNDPLAYPESSDAAMEKFPPTLLLTGTRAFDMSPVISAHARLLKLGVDASLYVMEGGIHGAHILAPGTPEAHQANAYIAHWFGRHLAQ